MNYMKMISAPREVDKVKARTLPDCVYHVRCCKHFVARNNGSAECYRLSGNEPIMHLRNIKYPVKHFKLPSSQI